MAVETSRMTPVLLSKPTACHSLSFATTTVETLKMTERRADVIENKGPLWKRWQISGNLIENKGT
jgi:hypothetical protein